MSAIAGVGADAGTEEAVGSGVASGGAASGVGAALGTAIGAAAGPAVAAGPATRGTTTGARWIGVAVCRAPRVLVGRAAGVVVGVAVGEGAGSAITGGTADFVAIGAGGAPLSSAGPAARGGARVGTGKRKVDGLSLCSAACAHALPAPINASANTAPMAPLRTIPDHILFALLFTEILPFGGITDRPRAAHGPIRPDSRPTSYVTCAARCAVPEPRPHALNSR